MFASGSPESPGSVVGGNSGASTVSSISSSGSTGDSSRGLRTSTTSIVSGPTTTSLESISHSGGYSSPRVSFTKSERESTTTATTATPIKSSIPAATPIAPYATTGGSGARGGKCHVHVNEFEDCEDDKHDLITEVTIWDVAGKQIGYQKATEAGATDPLSVRSKLEDPLVVTPEHRHNYVQFALGTENFDSRQQDQTGLAWCSTGGWDPKEGPYCTGLYEEDSVSISVTRAGLYFANKLHARRNGKWTVTSSAHIMEGNRLMVLRIHLGRISESTFVK